MTETARTSGTKTGTDARTAKLSTVYGNRRPEGEEGTAGKEKTERSAKRGSHGNESRRRGRRETESDIDREIVAECDVSEFGRGPQIQIFQRFAVAAGRAISAGIDFDIFGGRRFVRLVCCAVISWVLCRFGPFVFYHD